MERMRGNALVRRASDCWFLSALASCQLDISGFPTSNGMMPRRRKAFLTELDPFRVGLDSEWITRTSTKSMPLAHALKHRF